MADDKAQTTVSLVIDEDLLPLVDKRAAEQDLNRSQYFRRLAREDIARAKEERKATTQMRRAA